MSKRRGLIIVLGFLIVSCQSRWQVSTDDVVARHIAAVGGESAIARLTGWHVAAVVHDLPTPGKIETWVKAPGKVRIDSSISGIDETVAYDGREGWRRGPDGIESLTGARSRSIRSKAYLDDIVACRAANCTITREDDETIDGRKCHVLVLGRSRDDSVTAYVDSESFLIVRTVSPMLSQKKKRMRLEIHYSDYRRIGGVTVPFQREVRADYGNYRITAESFDLNVSPDDALFVPAPLQLSQSNVR